MPLYNFSKSWIKPSKRYTSYACICVYMHIAKYLPDSIMLTHEDTEWIQPLDYEHIPFRCRKCHVHGHLYRDCPHNKIITENKQTIPVDEEGFQKTSRRWKHGRKKPISSRSIIPPISNSFGILGTQPMDTGKDDEEVPLTHTQPR